MASMIQENWSGFNEKDSLDDFESLEIDDALLMSILDEPHVEDMCDDDERLSTVIRSLEAEISPIVIDDHDLSLELEWNVEWEGSSSSSSHQFSTNHNNYLKSQDLEYNWMEMDDENMYNNIQGYEDGIIEFGDVKDYAQFSYGNNNIEEHGYGALWQEIN